MKDTTDYFNKIAKQENDDALEGIRRAGRTEIVTLSADERKAWKRALMKVHAEMGEKVGKDLLKSIYDETGFDPNKL